MLLDAERHAFEERVLQYFDGSLAEPDAEALLSELETNADKAGIFAQYQELDKLIVTARIPLEAPEESKRALVGQIPGLLGYLPQLLGSSAAAPVAWYQGSQLINFFLGTPARLASTIGATAAIVTTSFLLLTGPSQPANTQATVPAEHSAKITQNETTLTQEATSPALNWVAPTLQQNATSRTTSNHAPTAQTSLRATDASPMLASHNVATERAFESDTNSTASPEDPHAIQSANASDETNGLNSDAIAYSTLREPSQAITPTMESLPARIFQPNELASRLPWNITASYSAGWRMLAVPTVAGNDLNSGGFTQQLDLNLPLSSSFAILLQGGRSTLDHLLVAGTTTQGIGSVPRYVIRSQVIANLETWARAGVHYNLTSATSTVIPFISATAGAVVTHQFAPMIGAGAGLQLYLSDAMRFVTNVEYDQSWMPADEPAATIPSDAIIEHQEFSTQTMNNAGFSITFGLSTTF